MRNILLNIFFLCFSFSVWAQKEGNHWFFGIGDGLNFNVSPPLSLNNGRYEGGREAAVMSDECGRLLFYSAGSNVRNSQHKIMENSEIGSAAGNLQAAVAIPYPGRDSIYVLFTINPSGSNDPFSGILNYSIIDMRLENGLGAVISRKNFLYDLGAVQMTPVRHANGRDFWLLAVEDREGQQTTTVSWPSWSIWTGCRSTRW